MEPTAIVDALGAGLLGLTVAAAGLVGLRLTWAAGPDHADGWLGLGLLGSALLVGAAAGLAVGGLDDPRGGWTQLAAFAAMAAGAAGHLLYVGFVYRDTSEGSDRLPAWGPLTVAAIPIGFLVYAAQHWPSTSLPADARPIDWGGWAGYDAVEDATGGLVATCLAVTILAVTLVLIARSLIASPERSRARRMLAQAWTPVLAWAGALGLVFAGLAVMDPPALAWLGHAHDLLLHSSLPFALLVLGPLQWGLDRVSLTGSPRGGASPASNRS